MSMGEQINELLAEMTPTTEADTRLQQNINIRQALAAKLLEDASSHSDPKILNLGLKALNDSDKVTLTQQRNAQDKEVAEDSNERISEVYRLLVERNGKTCIAQEDKGETTARPVEERVSVELDENEFELHDEEIIIGMDTANAMLEGNN